MSSLIKEVDARTGLAGTNQMELLLFHVGTSEVFGINVFKVREVMKFPTLTRLPEADPRVEGMANIRGTTVPVIGLTQIITGLISGQSSELSEGQGKLIVTEYNTSLQAFHVAGVDRILRLSWTQIKSPPPLVRNNTKGAVTAVAMLDDGRMVLILDVEKILAEMSPKSDEEVFAGCRNQTRGQEQACAVCGRFGRGPHPNSQDPGTARHLLCAGNDRPGSLGSLVGDCG